MRLYELQPFKQHPAYRAAQAIGTGTYTVTRDKLTAEMKRLGWTKAGSGLYAQVYTNPKFGYVIKVFDADSPNYVDYMSWVLQHQNNPFVPRLYGRIRQISPSAKAVRMELLQPIKTGSIYSKYIGPNIDDRYYNKKKPAWWNILDASNRPYLKQYWPDLAQVVDQLGTYKYLDIGGAVNNNIMRRGDTIVFTDPVAG